MINSIDSRKLLGVKIVSLVFDESEEARSTLLAGLEIEPDCRCFAILPPGSGSGLMEWWNRQFEGPLLILRGPSDNRFQMGLELLDTQPLGSLAVLTHQPADSRKRFGRKSEFVRFIAEVSGCRSDIQVHTFSSTWRMQPPRIR